MTTRATRLVLVATLCATLAGLAADAPSRRAEAAFPGQPHVIVIMADDLDVHTVETLLALGFMPNLEAFVAGRGVRFRQSFVTNSLCSVAAFTDPDPFDEVPRGDVSTLATWLRAAGYRGMPESSPLNAHYVPWGWNRWEALIDPSTYDGYI